MNNRGNAYGENEAKSDAPEKVIQPHLKDRPLEFMPSNQPSQGKEYDYPNAEQLESQTGNS